MNGTSVVFSPFFFFFLSPSSFCSSRQQHLVDVGWWRVYTLSCTRQRFTYRYVPAIVAITSPLMALHNVICRPAPFLSDLFAPIVIPLLPSPLFTFLSLSSSLSLFPDAWFSTINPVISYRERGIRVSSIKRPLVDIWYFEMYAEWDERWNFKIWRIYIYIYCIDCQHWLLIDNEDKCLLRYLINSSSI